LYLDSRLHIWSVVTISISAEALAAIEATLPAHREAERRADGKGGWARRWHQAQHQRFNEHAYALWEREGRPEGNADDHWFRTRAFKES
jgi:hypothetical protein